MGPTDSVGVSQFTSAQDEGKKSIRQNSYDHNSMLADDPDVYGFGFYDTVWLVVNIEKKSTHNTDNPQRCRECTRRGRWVFPTHLFP